MTEHSAAIVAGSWPSQMVMTWAGYAMEYTEAANRLFQELNTQYDIQAILAPMSGAFIDAARQLALGRQYALMNRIEAYRYTANKVQWAANELHSTKADLVETVNQAEEDIQKARQNAAQKKAAAAGNPVAVAAIESTLQSNIVVIVARAKADAQLRDSEGSMTVAGYIGDINNWSQPYSNFMLLESGGSPGVGAPGAPASPAAPTAPMNGRGSSTKPVDSYSSTSDTLTDTTGRQDSQRDPATNSQTNPQKGVEQTALRHPDKVGVKDAASTKPSASAPPALSAPATGGGSSGAGSSPGSVLGQMMHQVSSSPASAASPASAGSPASSTGGMPGTGGTPGGPNTAGPGTGAGAGVGAGAAAGAGRAVSAASAGGGIAEAAARMGTGAISATASALGNAGNVGSQIAQGAAAASQATPAATNPAAATTPAAAAPVGGGAPMAAMMPPTASAAAPVSAGTPAGPIAPNTGAGAPTTTPVAPPNTSGVSGPGPAASGGGSTAAPVWLPTSPIQAIGAEGATGDVLYDQAADAGQAVVQALIAQARTTAYITIHWAVSLIWERSGLVSAWLASSEGPSYIPLGVRIPEDVRLAVTDAVVGREMWDRSAAAGGANPLEVVVRHAEMRDAASPGARVLAVASSLPMGRVADWAGAVGARPVSVDPRAVDPAIAVDGALVHRCAVAMPWEWRQANAFTVQDRLKVAARHMHMAALSGHLTGHACEKVMRLFEERKPIDESLWTAVKAERNQAIIAFQMAEDMRNHGGGADPVRAFMKSRAAEVIQCLQHFDTAEGCADILYATRLAGAPLNPAAAVA